MNKQVYDFRNFLYTNKIWSSILFASCYTTVFEEEHEEGGRCALS